MDYHFVFATGGTIPAGAQPNGNEANGDPLWVARSPGATDPFFFHGGIHPGKVRPGFGAALIPFGGNEEAVPDYEVLMEAGNWIAGSGGQIPDGAVVCGREANGDPLFVARANLNGGLHPGKIRFAFGAALIGFGGQEVPVSDYVGTPLHRRQSLLSLPDNGRGQHFISRTTYTCCGIQPTGLCKRCSSHTPSALTAYRIGWNTA